MWEKALRLPNTYYWNAEPLAIRRRRIFENKQPGEEELGYEILELLKFAGVGKPTINLLWCVEPT